MKLTIGSEISKGIPFPFYIENLEDSLTAFFNSKQYGVIETIYSGFICVSKEYEVLHPVRPLKLLRKEPALVFEYKLDFDTYKNMNDEQREKYVATEYFKTLKEVLAKKKIKDFDANLFLSDLEQCLKSHQLLS
jgi:hypothetical protein